VSRDQWSFGIPSQLIWSSVSVIVALSIWHLLTHVGRIDAYLLPPPEDVAQRLLALLLSGDIAKQTGLTLYRTVVGLGLAVCAGSIIGLSMGKMRAIEQALDPVVSALFPTPKISFLPIFILWFGAFDVSKILIAAFICAFPIISACHEGVKDIDPRLSWVGRNMGMSEGRVFWKIVVPATIPALLTGVEVSLPFAFISVVTAEMIAGGGGIGSRMMLAARFADSKAVFAWLVALALIGALMTGVARILRQKVLRWHTEVH
jgi:ABC-type nitrate/sulfonate/bicarbonate transport system permease component